MEYRGCAPVDPYNIIIGPITHQVGVCESSTKNYKQFRPGECYEIRVVRTGMGDCGTCRYSASIDDISLPEGVVMVINDPQGLLGTNKQYTAATANKVAYVCLVKIEVANIKFDHTAGDTADGITINDATAPEWVKDGQNEPVAYKKTTDVTIKARFTVSPTSVTSAKISAATTDEILGNLGEQTVNFSNGVSNPEYITFAPSESTPIPVSKDTLTWQWKAKDLNGNSLAQYNINSSGPHTIYTVRNSPTCASSEITKDHLEWACSNAQDTFLEKDIADAIHLALNADPPIDGFGGTQTDGWELLQGSPYQGACDKQARFMVRVLNLLGTTGTEYLTYASRDAAVTTYESKTQSSKTWFLKFDFDNNGEVDNNFEGSVSAGGHYYAVWPSLDGASECGLLRQVGPEDFGATQRWVRTLHDNFGDPWVEHLSGTEGYPTCP